MNGLPSIASLLVALLAAAGRHCADAATALGGGAAAAIGGGSAAEAPPPEVCDWEYTAPRPTVLGRIADVSVAPGGYTIGGTFHPESSYPLVKAVKAGEALYDGQNPVVIEVSGIIGAGEQPHVYGGGGIHKGYAAFWTTAPLDIAIRGASGPQSDVILGFSVSNNNDGNPSEGVKLLRVENLTIRARSFQNAVVSSPMGLTPSSHGEYPRLQMYGCRFEKEGTGIAKWGARLHGRTRFDFRRNFFERVVEHCLYADSPQGDSHFMRNLMEGCTRTMLQVVNRKNEYPNLPSGYGVLLVERNVAENIDGDGGSDFTVVGHHGPVIFRNNTSIQADTFGQQGSIVVWVDAGKGVYLNPNGFATDKVIIENHIIVHPNADRSHISLAGIEEIEFRTSFDIQGNRIALDFHNSFSGPLPNGDICFGPMFTDSGTSGLSEYSGFQSPTKFVVQGNILTDAEIDDFGAQRDNVCRPC